MLAAFRALSKVSRLTERGVPWTLVWVPAEDPVFSAVGRFRALHPETVVALQVPEKLPLVKIEPQLVEQALVNFLENGRNYAGGLGLGAEIVLRDGQVEYQINDRGPGVPETEREGIFAKFARGAAAQKAGTRGSGLGLAIVREVASVHGGTAGVDSRPGGGAQFFLRIPLSAEPPPEGGERIP